MNTPCPVVIAWCLFYYTKTKVYIILYLNALTFREPGWIIVDIAEGDVHGGGPGQPPQLPPHVLGLD